MKINFVLFALLVLLVLLACCHLSLSQRSTKKPTTKKPGSKTAKPTKKGATPGPSKLSCDQSTPLKFTPLDDKEILANPERGYYRHHEIKLGRKYERLTPSILKNWANERKGVTLALMIFNIEPFVKKPLTEALKNIAADFDALRKGGMKAIVRFSYNQTDIEDTDNHNYPKTTDAEKPQLLDHIKQLTPIFKDNADVINVVQIGFIGHWGEWYYSRNYATEKKGEGWKPTPEQEAHRKEIVKALMAAVPNNRMLQIRYPAAKQKMYGNANLEPGADRTSERARLGIHNDCFVTDGGDTGTFETENNKESAQRKWLEKEGLSVMVGGETCFEKVTKFNVCPEAKKQIEKQRFTYLNTDYSKKVIEEWENSKCYKYIGNKMGYRFELVTGSLQSTVKKGGNFCLSLDIKNSGVAPLYNERPLEIILRDSKTKGSKSVKPIPYQPKVDPRTFMPDKTTSMKVTVQVPSELSPGQYDVIINLPDGSPSLKDEVNYRILFANGGNVQDKTNRLNIIGQITVQ